RIFFAERFEHRLELRLRGIFLVLREVDAREVVVREDLECSTFFTELLEASDGFGPVLLGFVGERDALERARRERFVALRERGFERGARLGVLALLITRAALFEATPRGRRRIAVRSEELVQLR